jgi:hypothetical protein
MRVMHRRLFLPLLLALCACTPLAPGGGGRTDATSIAGAFSAQRIVADRGHNLMIGQVFVLRQHDSVALTAELGQARHTGQGRLRMTSAWAAGEELPFRRASRWEPFCTAPGRCTGWRTGTFMFTRDTFAAARRDGFRATLIGPDDVVTVHYPPAMFAEARENARDLGLWP